MKKTLSFIVCIVMMITSLSGFSFTFASSIGADVLPLDYDALFDEAFVINGSWKASELKSGNSVSFYFRGKQITERYDASRHFSSFDTAYEHYLAQNPDILSDLPVFIFAPGTYNTKITVRYSAIILGANAGINPNADTDWTLDAMAQGVPENPRRTGETVFSAGITRTTRGDNNNAVWSFELEQKEKAAGRKADIKLIIDGITLTGKVGISQYDYSSRLYTDLNLNGQAINFTPAGNRNTLTALINSCVKNFSGANENSVFSARCDSMNKNDAVLKNVRVTDLKEEAKYLFNKYFRNLTIDGMYFSDCDASVFGTSRTGSAFCGNASASTAVYDQNIEIKNSVFYKNNVAHTISLGNCSGGEGYTKMTANIHHNFFYDAVCRNDNTQYWGIFLVNSAKQGVDYTVNITDNIIHQQSTVLQSLFNGSTNYQKSKTTINFNRNKVTGEVVTIYPNTNWNSSNYSYINSSLFYDFSNNFHAYSKDSTASRPDWKYPPKTTLANGYDYKTAPYYLDYEFNIHSKDFEISAVDGLGSKTTVNGCDIEADCSNMSGTVTPIITSKGSATIEIFDDATCQNKVTSIKLSQIEKSATYYIKISKGGLFVIGFLTIITGKYSDIYNISGLDSEKFNLPVLSVNTEGGKPLAKNDKENYVNCEVSISNTSAENLLSPTVAGIRYRGNSTLTAADKKPYRIKFDKKQNLFGMGKAKNWVLLANAFDKTMVRNAIAFAIGQQVGLEYTSEFQFVNLYFNGKYQGLYMLCEQTQTGKTRVDVEEDETGKVDTGYLVEFSGNGDPDEDRSFTINEVPKDKLADGVNNNWRTGSFLAYLKTPELEFCTDAQVEFISDYVNDVNYAILTKDWKAFNELCDVPSFAKYFVTSTVLNNGDGGYQVYMYKREDGGKLYAGPLWDFDQSSGATIQCGDTYDKWYTGSSHPWFDSFSTWPEFLELAKEIYRENYSDICEIINYYTTEFYPENKYDFHANDMLWDSVESDYWRITETIKKLKSYNANFSNLSVWFKNRLAWLDGKLDVTVMPSKITLDKTLLPLEKDAQYTFDITLTPKYYNTCRLIWKSSDPSVATVDSSGRVTAQGDGSAIITVSVDGSQVSAACTVTVCTAHVYDNDCDTDCNVCSKARITTHKYGDYLFNYDSTSAKDGTKTRVCTACGRENTITAVGTKLVDSSKQFTDVPESAWYKSYVDFAVTHGIFSGKGAGIFSPNANITRAEFVQVLANITGADLSIYKLRQNFGDVKSSDWFAGAVNWAYENNIVSGKGEGIFDPNAKITRQEMCIMLVKYASFMNITLLEKEPKTEFADHANIDGWAKDYVYKCQMADLVNGKGGNNFDPKGNALRCEASAIFTNFYKEYMK